MEKILQRLTTISLYGETEVVQPRENWVDTGDCNRVSVFVQVYGYTTITVGEAAPDPTAALYLENSATGDDWVDIQGGETATFVEYGKHTIVLSAEVEGDAAKFVGPLFRWRVAGLPGATSASITFRVIISGQRNK